VGFATLVIMAFALAGWYVSTRILAAEGVQAVVAPDASPSVSPTAASGRPAAQPFQSRSQEVSADVVMPLTLDYYLQVTALGTPQDVKYIQQLQRKGYQARLEAAGTGDDAQILIGPYSDPNALHRAQARLATAGILTTETVR